MKQILSHPLAYNFLQNLLLKKKSRGLLIEKYVKPDKKDHILDLGCGPGRLIDSLPEGIQYTGVDISAEYIEDAKIRYGNKYNFICSNIMDIDFSNMGTFDKVIAQGFFHHLDDRTILCLMDKMKPALSKHVQLVSLDGCYIADQNFISKFFLSNDRGNYVRTETEYMNLLKSSFNKVESFIHNDLLRIPYDHCILLCSEYRF